MTGIEGTAPQEPVAAKESWKATPEPTGDERVDGALAGLTGLGDVPVAEHVPIFENVHQRLHDVLAGIDQDEPWRPGEAE